MLGGFADEAELVRRVMRAAQAVIATYREASAGLLLPPLQAGLTDANYRIRQSSAELLGELMLRLTDSQPMAILEQGEANAPDSPLASIAPAAQHALLAALYIARNDEAVGVRQAANFVWKSLVSNAPKRCGSCCRRSPRRSSAASPPPRRSSDGGGARSASSSRSSPSACCRR